MLTRPTQISLQLALAALLGATQQAQAGLPQAMDSSLQHLAATASSVGSATRNPWSPLVTDTAGRVLVTVRMRDAASADATLMALHSLGFVLETHSELDLRLATGYLKPYMLGAAQALPGISATMAVHRPWRKASLASSLSGVYGAGVALSTAVGIHRADAVQAMGIDGTGIRVGVLSDSFDRCGPPACSTTATMDIATGDLPAAGVTVLAEGRGKFGADEGRAMLQLVHDIAPGATLGFAAATNDQLGFAKNMLALRNRFKADVIVDDVAFTDEPLLGDGLISKAIAQVVQSGGIVVSAAGNAGQQGYEAIYNAMSFSDASALSASGAIPVKLQQIPEALRPQTVHVFGTHLNGGGPRVTQRLNSSDGFIANFQWDEPFDRGAVATDYDLYLFDDQGNWIDPAGAPDSPVNYTMNDNVALDRPEEFFNVFDTREIYLVVGKRNTGPASHFKYVMNGFVGVEGGGSPAVFGHAAARGVLSVGGTEPTFPFEYATGPDSVGPFTAYLDADGNRFAKPEVRQAPNVLAVQNTDTTFFGGDTDGDGFPNFSGSSASAPVAGGIAALLLQSAGGAGSLMPERVNTLLEKSATRLLLPENADTASAKAGPLKLTAKGQETVGRDYFLVELAVGAPAVKSFSLDLSNTRIGFSAVANSSLGEVRGVSASDMTRTVSSDKRVITFTFNPGKFKTGGAFQFGWLAYGRGSGGGSLMVLPFEMEGAALTVTLEDGRSYSGALHSGNPKSVNRFSGFGMLDALSAVQAARAGH